MIVDKRQQILFSSNKNPECKEKSLNWIAQAEVPKCPFPVKVIHRNIVLFPFVFLYVCIICWYPFASLYPPPNSILSHCSIRNEILVCTGISTKPNMSLLGAQNLFAGDSRQRSSLHAGPFSASLKFIQRPKTVEREPSSFTCWRSKLG